MKKFFLISTVFIISASQVNAQAPLTDKQLMVQRTVTDMFQAIADRNTDDLKYYCTEDILILENGVVWNLDTLIQRVSQNAAPDFRRINTFEFFETKVSGKFAWVTYYNQADVTRNGKSGTVKWLETAILIKENGDWKIKTLHSTLL